MNRPHAVTPERHAALAVLSAVSRGRRLDRAFAEGASGLKDREIRWTQEAAYGVSRLRGRLDHLLDHYLSKGVGSVSPNLLDVLRLGAYQLLHMHGVPAHAAVSQAVEQGKAVAGTGGGRLTNGVLRAMERDAPDVALFPDEERDPIGFLSTWGSHPRWLVERWLGRWPVEDVRRLVEHNNSIPPLYLRPLGLAEEEAVRRLEAQGIQVVPAGRGTECLQLPAGSSPRQVLEAIPGIIQDPGSALVTSFAAPEPGTLVADLCAAPGGKALAVAQGASYVVAADPSAPRAGVLRENIARVGGPIGVVVARAQEPPIRSAPTVLLDVPCTGTGTLRRHPDTRWRLKPEDVGSLARIQQEILEGASAIVPVGGLLIYATCSLEPEENEIQVDSFMEGHPDFRREPSDSVEAGLLDAVGQLRVLPHETGFDGSFASRLRRVA